MLKNCLAHIVNMLSDSSCFSDNVASGSALPEGGEECRAKKFWWKRVLNGSKKKRLSRRRLIWFLPHPLSTVSTTVSKLDRRHTGRLRKRDNLLTEDGRGGSKSCDCEKAWFSVNHSILSGWWCPALETRSVSVLEIGLLQFWEYREIYSCF
jgi:hypothetical protein